ncbi:MULTISPECIES: hypothetical protein [Bacillus]|uniref:hypothetical protein n=1 Tax=Bacillus TaxID=1386 RepID=UPI0015965666|nr:MULTISPECIES: hypothetical protein [Bacillus]
MRNLPSSLYKISISDGQELMWYHADVKRGNNVFTFEIYRAIDTVSVFYVDELGRKRAIVDLEELETMLVLEEDRKHFRNFVGDTEWLLLDGMCSQRGMTKGEVAAFLYLKEHVLNEMGAELEG